jgi:hypothetical protein
VAVVVTPRGCAVVPLLSATAASVKTVLLMPVVVEVVGAMSEAVCEAPVLDALSAVVNARVCVVEGWLDANASLTAEPPLPVPPPHAASSVRMAATELLSSKRGWAGARYGLCILGTYCWVGAAWRSVVRRLKVIVGSGGPDFACRLLTLQKQ